MLNSAPNWEEIYRNTIYAVSHDLGAPCRNVRVFSEMLLDNNKGLNEDSKRMMQNILHAGLEAQAMLDGLLKLSRVYSQPTGFSVVDSGVVAKRFDCSREHEQIDAHVCVNLERLEVAANELKNNACLYGEFAGFRVTTRPKWLSVTALDQGPGISEEEWESAIQPLQRSGKRPTAEHVGMGLPIAMAIAGLMNGALVNNAEGVSIELPLL